ncbi:chitin-binding domain protein cbd-1 [Drosophila erecta]|uniref:Chitin-binding type-2 domain-containing protein n=1 Tax=Drosophila erecta TaxID=7220 RepID=B3NHF0_DROER|nr:chitin-binding domain protein cbd-1 [Drosophila erecta]EDV51676.1 uncharacterized protein Dere_GG13771 [Drosophila erecta]
MSFEVSWLSLLILTGYLASTKAETFPQCANAPLDTFVMAIEDCASYIYCNGEDSFRDSCPESTYFDDRTQECAFDDEGVCLRNPDLVLPEEQTTAVSTPASEYASTGSADSSTSAADPATPSAESVTTPLPTSPKPSSPALERPHCDASGDGDHPHPQRCEYYYRCLSGYLTIVRCPYKHGWDLPTKQCRPIGEAHCFSYRH